MSLLDGVRHRLYVLLRGEAYMRETERELRFHLELEALAATSGGRDARGAELAARRNLGSVTYYREEVRRMTSLQWLDRIRQDLSYAWRGLRRAPAFTATVVITLALGLGLNAALYSFLDRVFFRAPPGVVAPAQVKRVYVHMTDRLGIGGGRFVTSSFAYPQYASMRELLDDPGSMSAFTEPESVSVLDATRIVPVRRSYVTANYFSLLGVRPQRGRFFTSDEGRIEEPAATAVISDGLWRREFGADPDVLGKTILAGKRSFTIVGVGPEEFTGVSLDRADLWLPINAFPGVPRAGRPWYTGRGNYFRIIARAPTSAADQRLRTVTAEGYRRGYEQAYGRRDSASVVLTGPLAEARGPRDRQQELTVSTRLAVVALLVLAIACANVANLLIVRAMRRRREIAVRRALGVSNGRLYGQLLTESLLLAAIAGVVAVVLAFWGAGALRRMLLPNVHWGAGAVDLSVIVFTALVAVCVGVGAGLAPAAQATKPDLINSLRAGSGEGAYRRSPLRGALLAVQAALSVVLVVGATLFVRSLNNIQSIDIGYDSAELIYARPFYDEREQGDSPQVRAAVVEAARDLAAIPGIEAVSIAAAAPMAGSNGFQVFLPGRELPAWTTTMESYPSGNAVSETFFATVGLRLIAGRLLEGGDRQLVAPNAPTAIVASSAMANALWPGENAVGKCVLLSKRTNPCTTVIGVVEDGRQFRIIERPPLLYYFPSNALGETTVLVRANPRIAASVRDHVRRVMAAHLPGAPYVSASRMADNLEPEMRPWRLGAGLFAAMGVLALIVAAIGVYSVVAYSVSQRTHEMGVRIALGAGVRDILDLVAFEGVRPVLLGVLLGIAASLALGRFVASLLFGVTPYDLSAMLTAASLLGVLGLVASLIPGIRAARVDPVTALRAE